MAEVAFSSHSTPANIIGRFMFCHVIGINVSCYVLLSR